MPFNQRFIAAIDHIQKHGLIRFEKDLMASMGWKRGRLTYLKSPEAKELYATESDQLSRLYPIINWSYVNSGKGKMLLDEKTLNEPVEPYSTA